MSLQDSIQELYDEHGYITPRIVLDTARDPEHPLHRYFDWNDATAAETARLSRARQLISRCKITVINPGTEETVRVRTFVSVPAPASTPVFKHVSQLLPQEELAVRAQMRSEIDVLVQKYKHLREFWTLMKAAIENVA